MDSNIITTLEIFSEEINSLLKNNLKALYVYGSAVYDDLHMGYSDLDFLAIISDELNEEISSKLREYRHIIKTSNNPYYKMLEGEFISYKALTNPIESNSISWGGSGERLNSNYEISGFSLKGLIDNGVLVYGEDIKKQLPYPTDEIILAQIDNLINTIRIHAVSTSDDVHSVDWLFLICQSIYWLKTKEITCKTKATQWVIDKCNFDFNSTLLRALSLRHTPELVNQADIKQWLLNLGNIIQKACNILDTIKDIQFQKQS